LSARDAEIWEKEDFEGRPQTSNEGRSIERKKKRRREMWGDARYSFYWGGKLQVSSKKESGEKKLSRRNTIKEKEKGYRLKGLSLDKKRQRKGFIQGTRFLFGVGWGGGGLFGGWEFQTAR